MSRNSLTPQQIADIFTTEFGDAVTEARVTEWAEGTKKTSFHTVWIEIERTRLNDALKRLVEIDFPHLSVISGADTGDAIELMYHLYVYFGIRNGEIGVTFKVSLPKSDLRIPTISGIIPGAVYSEREKQEMLGIEVVEIPDSRGLFLPADFPKGVYPWRKDETGVTEDMVKNLWAVGRPENRPAPPVKPKEKKEPAKKPEAGSPEAAEKPAPEETSADTGAAETEVKSDE